MVWEIMVKVQEVSLIKYKNGGTVLLNKIYILAHKHFFECRHEDDKLIGIFLSKKEALKVLDDYKKIKGFKEHIEGFYIQECIIDKIDNTILNELIKT